MEKPVAAIEFGSKKLKLVVGYELDGQVYVIYALNKPYGHLIEPKGFIDPSKLIQSVKDIRDFSDPSAKLKLTISEVSLCLPPFGVNVYQTNQMTAVISEFKKIQNIDIKNIYALIKSGYSKTIKDELVDIIPESYILEEGRAFAKAPINEISSSLSVNAKVHTLPYGISKEFHNILNTAGMSVKRSVVAPFAACELLNSYEDLPKTYLLVDIGSNITTVSLICRGSLLASKFIEWGGDLITDRIANEFNISEAEAEKIKIQYGLDNREMVFRAPVCESNLDETTPVKHYGDELNSIIQSELVVFNEKLNETITNLVFDYNADAKSTSLILIGGGSSLNGLIDYLKDNSLCNKIIHVTPRCFGARDGTYANCLGMILASAKYPCVYDDSAQRLGTLSREDK